MPADKKRRRTGIPAVTSVVIILVRVFESLQFTLFPRINEHREHDTCGGDTKEDKNKSNGNSFHKHKKTR